MKKWFCILFLFLWTVPVYGAEEENEIMRQLDIFDFREVNEALSRGLSDGQDKIDIKNLAVRAVKGELDLSPGHIFDSLIRSLLQELLFNGKLMVDLMIVGLLSALLKTLTDSFQNKGVGELGFYACYIVLVILMFASLRLAVDMSGGLITALSRIMEASIPVILGLLVLTGNVAGAAVFQPTLIFAAHIVVLTIKNIILPLIVLAAVIQLINYLGNRDILKKLADFAKTGIGWALKTIITVFMFVLSLQRITAPILNNLALKTARFTVGSLPIVGNLLSGTMDTVLYWSSAAKNGVVVALVIGVIIACALPLIKIAAMVMAFKLTAGILQPVCDERIIKCVDGMADFVSLLAGVSVTVAAMFIFTLMIVLSF